MNWILENWTTLLAIVGGLVSVATIVVGLTPNKTDDSVLAWVVKILNFASVVNPKAPTVPKA
jgi:hypothetical protein